MSRHVSGPRAVVIGSGIGGSAATLLLADAGIPTTLIEKNRRLGGSCASYEKAGFKIDIGTHLFCRGPVGPLGDVLRRVGRDGDIQFRRTRDIAEIRVGTGGTAEHPAQLVSVRVPSALRRIPAFAWQLARALGLSPREAFRVAKMFTRILTMSPREIESWNHRTVEDFVRPMTDHPPTVGIFGFLLGLYFVLPFWEVSAGEAIWSFQKMAIDNWLSYPVGGSSAVPGTYCRLAEERGAEIRVGTGVRRVLIEQGRTVGVELEDGTVIPAEIVVSTSSVRTTALRLVGAHNLPSAYVDRARALKGSYIAVQAKIGLRKPLVKAGSIVGGVGDSLSFFELETGDLRKLFDSITEGRVPPIVPFYCPVPTNFDPGLAPPGHQLLTVCAVAPTSDIDLKDPGHVWEEAMLRAMRRVVPGLEEHALFIDRFSVDFIEKWIGKEHGPAISTAQSPDQVGSLRPAVTTPIRGLYIAGCGAGGRGVGTELAAASAMECVDRILADLGHNLRAVAAPNRWTRLGHRWRAATLQTQRR